MKTFALDKVAQANRRRFAKQRRSGEQRLSAN
jgi:hypothetical protein